MGYYDNQRMMKLELQELIRTTKEKRIAISGLVVHYGLKFGFGRRILENALKDFHDNGQIILTKNEFEVLKQ